VSFARRNPETAYCTTLLLTALLGWSGVFSDAILVACMGIVDFETGRYRGCLD
jgi:hypothetical protein